MDGGVQQVVIGLAHGLSKLDGPEQYLFLTYDGAAEWLQPYLGGACRELVWGPPPPGPSRLRQKLSRYAGLRSIWQNVRHAKPPALERSTGLIENSGVRVMHFTKQSAFVTDVPSVFQPHDLQHRHLPEFFPPLERRLRDMRYRAFCNQAAMVAVASTWVKRDLIAQYGIPAEKISVINWAPPTEAYQPVDAVVLKQVRERLRLPERYIFYPSQTWPHKNHLGLLRALATLRDDYGLTVPLVGSGRKTAFFREIEREVQRLSLGDQVHFVGFVRPAELQALYKMSVATVIPTKFEAASYPAWEAFSAGVPVACSRVTSLPDQVGDAALTFDPDSVPEIAAAINRLWTDASLRAQLVVKGKANVARFSWDRTARIFRAHYRRIGGEQLSPVDVDLINQPPLL